MSDAAERVVKTIEREFEETRAEFQKIREDFEGLHISIKALYPNWFHVVGIAVVVSIALNFLLALLRIWIGV